MKTLNAEMPASDWFWCSACQTTVHLPHDCLRTGDKWRFSSNATWPVPTAAVTTWLGPDTSSQLARVHELLATLRSGDHASESRDFGRGVAYAAGLLAAVLERA